MTTEQQAEKYAADHCAACNDRRLMNTTCDCGALEAAFIAGASSVEMGGRLLVNNTLEGDLWVNRKRGTFNPSKLFEDDERYIKHEELKKVGDFEKAYIKLCCALEKFTPYANLVSVHGTIFEQELNELKESSKEAQEITWKYKAFSSESPSSSEAITKD